MWSLLWRIEEIRSIVLFVLVKDASAFRATVVMANLRVTGHATTLFAPRKMIRAEGGTTKVTLPRSLFVTGESITFHRRSLASKLEWKYGLTWEAQTSSDNITLSRKSSFRNGTDRELLPVYVRRVHHVSASLQ